MEGLIIALWIMSECKRHVDEQLSCDGCIFSTDGNCMVKFEEISNHNLTEKLANIFTESKEESKFQSNMHWKPKEPFINKPCISEGVCHEDKMKVLEKIRDEIEEVYVNLAYKENYNLGASWGLRKALEIIDKYMAESEGE